ncbi:hypothetical protein BB560_004594, partial [Smittium megazygosporum]
MSKGLDFKKYCSNTSLDLSPLISPQPGDLSNFNHPRAITLSDINNIHHYNDLFKNRPRTPSSRAQDALLAAQVDHIPLLSPNTPYCPPHNLSFLDNASSTGSCHIPHPGPHTQIPTPADLQPSLVPPQSLSIPNSAYQTDIDSPPYNLDIHPNFLSNQIPNFSSSTNNPLYSTTSFNNPISSHCDDPSKTLFNPPDADELLLLLGDAFLGCDHVFVDSELPFTPHPSSIKSPSFAPHSMLSSLPKHSSFAPLNEIPPPTSTQLPEPDSLFVTLSTASDP